MNPVHTIHIETHWPSRERQHGERWEGEKNTEKTKCADFSLECVCSQAWMAIGGCRRYRVGCSNVWKIYQWRRTTNGAIKLFFVGRLYVAIERLTWCSCWRRLLSVVLFINLRSKASHDSDAVNSINCFSLFITRIASSTCLSARIAENAMDGADAKPTNLFHCSMFCSHTSASHKIIYLNVSANVWIKFNINSVTLNAFEADWLVILGRIATPDKGHWIVKRASQFERNGCTLNVSREDVSDELVRN